MNFQILNSLFDFKIELCFHLKAVGGLERLLIVAPFESNM